jgi:membrane protease YdiL (CAAX protease family)
MVAVFVVGSFIVRRVGFLDDQVRDVTDHADRGAWPLLVLVTAATGVAEELFFRGALYDVVPRPVAATTVVYGVTTLATGNLLLTFAAFFLGAVVGLERRRYGGVVPSILTHCTWSLSMLLLLPALFHR